MRFSVYQVSRKGGREKNEDRMGYCYTRDAGLFALADGMGGHPEGEVASQMALQKLSALFQREARPKLAEPLKFLHDAIIAGHHQLLRYATERLETITALRIIGTAREKASVISFTLCAVHPHDIGTILDQHGIAVRASPSHPVDRSRHQLQRRLQRSYQPQRFLRVHGGSRRDREHV